MPATYEPIATTTLSSAAANITFSSIGSGYTDLRLVVSNIKSNSTAQFLLYRLNSDTASNYSWTIMYGNGTTAASLRNTSQTYGALTFNSTMSTTQPSFYTADFFNYAGSTNKTCLITSNKDANGSGEVERAVSLWRQTSAINNILIYPDTGTLAAGTTATLYGILKA